jgi:hypothetical protein
MLWTSPRGDYLTKALHNGAVMPKKLSPTFYYWQYSLDATVVGHHYHHFYDPLSKNKETPCTNRMNTSTKRNASSWACKYQLILILLSRHRHNYLHRSKFSYSVGSGAQVFSLLLWLEDGLRVAPVWAANRTCKFCSTSDGLRSVVWTSIARTHHSPLKQIK